MRSNEQLWDCMLDPIVPYHQCRGEPGITILNSLCNGLCSCKFHNGGSILCTASPVSPTANMGSGACNRDSTKNAAPTASLLMCRACSSGSVLPTTPAASPTTRDACPIASLVFNKSHGVAGQCSLCSKPHT